MQGLNVLSYRNSTELNTTLHETYKYSKITAKEQDTTKKYQTNNNTTNTKAITPHNNKNGEKVPTFLSSTRLGEEVEASHPLSYHLRPKMRREEARKSEDSSKEKKEQRRMGENGEG